MAEIAEIPENIVDEMLDAQAKVVVAAHKSSIISKGLHKSGLLASSIKSIKKRNGGKRYVLVYPTGDHHKYSGREKTGVYARSKSGRTYTYGGGTKTATNNDVGFVHEFGSDGRNIKASQWMKEANERSAEETTQAAFRVYDNWLKSKNL